MTDRKQSGSFYTPTEISDFLVDYILDKFKNRKKLSILEPSAGDGSFIKSLYKHDKHKSFERVIAIEKDKEELDKIGKAVGADNLELIHADFLEYQKQKLQGFSLIIGNPPYIKKNYLTDKQKQLCQEIQNSAGLQEVTAKNIWASFLIRCIQFTSIDGVLAFVLPAEFLQVKFSKELRDLVAWEFQRVEIFTFDKLLFPDCKGQDTVLLICERKSENKGVFYCKIEDEKQLCERNFNLTQNISIQEAKWIHHHLNSDEITLMEKLKSDLKTISDYCSSKPGIVTAANSYFIVNQETVKRYHLERFTQRIIQKGLFVNGSVVFNNRDFNSIVKDSKPAFLIKLDDDTEFSDHHPINEYLMMGEALELNKRYKMTKRDNWAVIPNIVAPGHGLFFKRCNEYPKLLKNYAKVLATDSAYIVQMKKSKHIESLIYSFYNSLTLAYAEFYGRFYGGGVLELIPSEFKKLPVPYVNISKAQFTSYTKEFETKKNIREICSKYDQIILKSAIPSIDSETLAKISSILGKFHQRRLRK